MDMDIMGDILEERAAQDKQWGGPEHDDEHRTFDWFLFIMKQANGTPHRPEQRERFVKIAALAIAAIESMERKQAVGKVDTPYQFDTNVTHQKIIADAIFRLTEPYRDQTV